MTAARGRFVLSLDTELAWGTMDMGGLDLYANHFRVYRPTVRRLLDLLCAYDVPATWAVVGHLFLERCRKGPDGSTHPDVLRPQFSWFEGDWHRMDPGTDVEHDPFWYAPDVIDWIKTAPVRQEIGSHTFTHVVFDDPACTREIARSQLEACVRLGREHGIELRSLVFPRNRIAHLDAVAEAGFTCYRGVEESWYRRWPGPLRRLAHLLDRAAAVSPPTYEPRVGAAGLVSVPASMFLMPADGIRRYVPFYARVLQAERGLNEAAERGTVFHLWFHPFNLGSDPRLFDALEEILALAHRLRRKGKLELASMGQVAAAVRS